MCGICGIVNLDKQGYEPIDQTVSAMINRLGNRGPDGSWAAGNEQVLFGMTRLAIRGIDNGQQPLVDPETGVMVVCNGEIDNHQELRLLLAERGRTVKQDTDVAVLPGLYLEFGEAFLQQLAGAFAIAVWDPRQQSLLLARDRAGERPLFYRQFANRIVFASQVSALAEGTGESPKPDLTALHRFLQLGHFPAPDSPFEHYCKVPPGTSIQFDFNGARSNRYWRWREPAAPTIARTTESFDPIFREAVYRQSEVDVDFGLFLSGGVDSSLVSAVTRAVRPGKALTAYGLRFGEASYDEGEFAEKVAQFLDIEYVPVWVKPEDLPTILSELIEDSGEPLADPAWVPTALLARRAAEDIRIALVGEGADELFGGYPTYFGARLAEYYSRLPAAVRDVIRKKVESIPPSDKKVTLSFLMKRFVQGDTLDGVARHVLWTSSVSPQLLERLGINTRSMDWSSSATTELLDQLQQFDLERPLAEGLLTKADRASMHWALELRAPFLDPAVMDFAATLLPSDRVRALATKVFLKKYAVKYLPKEIVYRRKRGLSVPLAAWLRGPLREWAETGLKRPALEALGIRRQATLELFEEHQSQKADHARALWTLLVLSEWVNWVDGRNQLIKN